MSLEEKEKVQTEHEHEHVKALERALFHACAEVAYWRYNHCDKSKSCIEIMKEMRKVAGVPE